MVEHGKKEENEAIEDLMQRIKDEEGIESLKAEDLPTIAPLPVAGEGQETAESRPFSSEVLRNVRMKVKVELGRAQMPLRKALALSAGSVVELGKATGDAVDLLVNDVPIARGQILVVDRRFCVRITEILSSGETR